MNTFTAWRFTARCTCGWESNRRVDPNNAVTDGENHLARVHPSSLSAVYTVNEVAR
jgi:hypothetical protein